jgi:Fic-DOC domain mobile mystery protein B
MDRIYLVTMMDPLVPIGDGHTALSEEDRLGLIPTYIATRGDLFDAEQRNISNALLRRRPPLSARLLDDKYLRDLHRAMFSEVWEWAGRYRLRETNLGIDPTQIATAVRLLVEDAQTWVEYGTYRPDELAVRFHHRLVAIHPFPNGNGRHGRIAADYLVRGLGGEPFSWAAGVNRETDELRAAYRHALQRADAGEIAELLAFARS